MNISAHANTAKTDGAQLIPDDAALGPPGVELLTEPELMGRAEHELNDTTTEEVLDAAFSVVLNVAPVKIIT
jgi:hypothetical protein